MDALELDSGYWRGVAHGLLLALPLLALFYRRWKQIEAAAASALQAGENGSSEDAKPPPTLGTFLNELFTYEVVLVAGAEMKAVKDQLRAAEQEGNARRVDALRGRLLDVARVLDQKLQALVPIVQFLTEQSVRALAGKDDGVDLPGSAAESDAEPKKDK